MKQKDILKVVKNSIDNFLIEFYSMNKLHNNKVDDNVISFGALIPKFEFYFLVKKIDETLKEHIEEMFHEMLADYGYHYNLNMPEHLLTNKEEYENLLKRKDFECIFIKPDNKNSFKNCNPKHWDTILHYFNKYVNNQDLSI